MIGNLVACKLRMHEVLFFDSRSGAARQSLLACKLRRSEACSTIGDPSGMRSVPRANQVTVSCRASFSIV